MACAASRLKIFHDKPKVWPVRDGQDVIHFHRAIIRDQPLAVRLDFAERIPAKLPEAKLFPCCVVSTLSCRAAFSLLSAPAR